MSQPTILHLDQPRSGGSLLQRILSGQPQQRLLDHPFAQARGKQVQWLTCEDYAEGMDDNLRQQFHMDVRAGMERWTDELARARQADETLVIHEHCFNSAPPETVSWVLEMISGDDHGAGNGMNVLGIPETLALQPHVMPVFTIRDPRLAVPSAYRALGRLGLPHGSGRANFSVSTNPVWIRLLYSWYTAHGVDPIIVDCDDIQTAGTTDFLQRLCVRLGRDPAALRFAWPKITEAERSTVHPLFYASQNTLLESSGIDPGLAACNRDIQAEEDSWEADFGEDVQLVREMIRQAQVHYTWLRERKFD